MNWRHQVEASFRFDPTNAITKDDLRNLDITAQQYQRDLLHRLIALARRVEEAVNRASMKAAEAKAMVDRAAHLLAQAKADVEVAQAVRRPA
jgi:hypothetical protein